MPWKRYVYGNSPSLVPLDGGDTAPWPSDRQIRLAGFEPDDSELAVTRLRRAWDGHPRGAVVLTGLTCQGHPFAIRWRRAARARTGEAS